MFAKTKGGLCNLLFDMTTLKYNSNIFFCLKMFTDIQFPPFAYVCLTGLKLRPNPTLDNIGLSLARPKGLDSIQG